MVFLPIPDFERYVISQNGTIIDSVEEIVIQHRDSVEENTKVRLLLKNRTNRFRTVSVARLILITHKPLEGISLQTLWAPKLINKEMNSVTASNLEYDFGEYNPPAPLSDLEFFPVPEDCPGLEINKRGEVRLRGTPVEKKIIKGYSVVSLKNKNGTTRYIGVYRLLALTFLRHPINTDELLVNHMDGKSLNDSLSNLEWTTYYGNMIHAHESRLVVNHHYVEVMNLDTKEVLEYFSIGSYSRSLKLNQRETKRLEFRMRMFGVVANYRNHAIRFKIDPPDWESLINFDKYKGNTREVVAVNELMKAVHEFLWFKDAVDFLQVSGFRLRESLRRHGTVKIGNYFVSYYLPGIVAGNSTTVKSAEVKD